MLVAVVPEARPVPDVSDALGRAIAHARVRGDVVTADHHVAARVDVEALENEGTGNLVGVEIGAGIGRATAIEGRVDAPCQEFSLDEIVDADFLDPEFLYRVDIDSLLIDAGG